MIDITLLPYRDQSIRVEVNITETVQYRATVDLDPVRSSSTTFEGSDRDEVITRAKAEIDRLLDGGQ